MPKNEAVKAWAKKMVPRTEADAAHKEAASPLPGFDKKKKPKKPKKEPKWASMKDPETSFYRLGQKYMRSNPKTQKEKGAMLLKLDAAAEKARDWFGKQIDKVAVRDEDRDVSTRGSKRPTAYYSPRKYKDRMDAFSKRSDDLYKKVRDRFFKDAPWRK